ncbi:hypothetical protein PG988_000275 [Apiospora saccharicola]
MRRYSLTQCPDPTDTLWAGNGTLEYGGFCCEPGYNDFYEGRMEGVGCTAAGVRTLQTNEYFALTVRTVACVRSASFPLLIDPDRLDSDGDNGSDRTSSSSSSSSSSVSSGTIARIAVGAV